MSALSDKIDQHKKKLINVKRVHSEKYRKAIWHLMIAYGGVREKEVDTSFDYEGDNVDYYGCKADISLAKTKQFLTQHPGWNEIDWQSIGDPAEHIGYGFNGTYASSQLRVPYLAGDLVFKDGSSYRWLVNCADSSYGDESGFANLIQFLQLDISLEEAVNHLIERTKTHDSWRFKYDANIPSLSE